MQLRSLVFAALALFLGTLGYFFGAIVVAIYAALALGKDKMAFETGLTPHLIGAAGALAGVALAWVIASAGSSWLRSRAETTTHP
jgi:hypothetical protein